MTLAIILLIISVIAYFVNKKITPKLDEKDRGTFNLITKGLCYVFLFFCLVRLFFASIVSINMGGVGIVSLYGSVDTTTYLTNGFRNSEGT